MLRSCAASCRGCSDMLGLRGLSGSTLPLRAVRASLFQAVEIRNVASSGGRPGETSNRGFDLRAIERRGPARASDHSPACPRTPGAVWVTVDWRLERGPSKPPLQLVLKGHSRA